MNIFHFFFLFFSLSAVWFGFISTVTPAMLMAVPFALYGAYCAAVQSYKVTRQ